MEESRWYKGKLIHPEPDGYDCSPTFVKSNPKNNEVYIDMCTDELGPNLATLLHNTNRQIKNLAPGYNIAQIKEKFGTLRFYADLPEDTTDENYDKIQKIITQTEQDGTKILQENMKTSLHT